MPTPWSPFLGPPWTFAETWPFALMLAADRAECRHKKQKVTWEEEGETGPAWLITDAP